VPLLILALLVLAALAGAAYWFLGDDEAVVANGDSTATEEQETAQETPQESETPQGSETPQEPETPEDTEPPEEPDAPAEPAPSDGQELPAPVETAGCDRDELRRLTSLEPRPLDELMAFAEGCGPDEAELRLTAVEAAAAAGHPPALLAFCAWYDPTNPSREGSPLAANAVSAIRYCAEAAAAGEPGAAEAQGRLCEVLAAETDPIAVMSREMHCRE
jgi:hypothetical protein